MKCQKIECQNQATKSIILLISVHANHTPAESTPFVHVCEEHSKDITFDTLVDDKSFEIISNKFESIGRQRPVRKFCSLKIIDIDENKNTKNEDRNRLQ